MDHLILLVFLLYKIQSSRDMENLGLATVSHYLGFWICKNLIYLITGLFNHPSILCIFLSDEESFANCIHGMQTLLYGCFSLLTRKTAQDFIALCPLLCQTLEMQNIFLAAHMNNECSKISWNVYWNNALKHCCLKIKFS